MQTETPAVVNKLVDKIIEEENLKGVEVIIKSTYTSGANNSSKLYNLSLKCPENNLELFAKVACIGKRMREIMKSERFFATERFVYKSLRKIYEEIQIRNKIPENRRFVFPKFYACSDRWFEETMILENLTAKGYTMYHRFKPVTWEYASVAIEQLAKLHALSNAFAEDDPAEFAKVVAEREMVFSSSEEELSEMWRRSEVNALDALPEDSMKVKLKAFLDKESGLKGYNKYYKTDRRPVLLHGDYRSSNLLHKITNGKVEKLVPVDYETMHDGSPICDILFFIFSGTDADFRKRHFTSLIDHYYSTFKDFLMKLGLDPQILYPREDFDEDFRKRLPYGLLFSVLLLPIILIDQENARTLDGEDSVTEFFAIRPNEIYKKRFLEIFEDYEKWGIV